MWAEIGLSCACDVKYKRVGRKLTVTHVAPAVKLSSIALRTRFSFLERLLASSPVYYTRPDTIVIIIIIIIINHNNRVENLK